MSCLLLNDTSGPPSTMMIFGSRFFAPESRKRLGSRHPHAVQTAYSTYAPSPSVACACVRLWCCVWCVPACACVCERVAVRGVATAAVCLCLYLAVLAVLCVAIVYLSCIGVYIILPAYLLLHQCVPLLFQCDTALL